jgi:hypothetical protein
MEYHNLLTLRSSTHDPHTNAVTLQNVVSNLSSNGLSISQCVARIMEELELIAEKSTETAVIYMIHLWSIAGMHYMHDITDGIDLWIQNNMTPEIRKYINLYKLSIADPALTAHFDGLSSV